MKDLEHDNWKGNTGGTPWMQRTLVRWLKHTPLQLPYFCMAWMVPFYMLFNHQGYLAIYHYFRQRHGYGPLKAFGHVYLNHFRFGQVIIDRFAMFAGKRFKLEVKGQELFDELDREEKGFLIISSHVGNYELAGYTLVPKNKTFNALVFAGESEQMMKGRNQMFAGKRINMIPMMEDLSHIFKINSALADGNIVSIPGDRIFGSPRHVAVDFMGGKANFPLGPFAIAAQRDIKVLAVFVMKTGIHRYHAKVVKLETPEATQRKEMPVSLATAFAKELETVVREHPEQWFNFFEFWNESRGQ